VHVTVRLFAGLRERAGTGRIEVDGVERAGDVWPRLDLGDEPAGLLYAVGRVEIGEASVVIAVSAPHRAAALRACHEAIDTLKETIPLWKKEVYAGGEEWIGRGS
jgi:hypothetical protein